MYRYILFLYALTKDNRYAPENIDGIIVNVPSLMSDVEKLFSAHSDWSVGDLMKKCPNRLKQHGVFAAIVTKDSIKRS